MDDQNPAALKYTYGSNYSGGPVVLQKIVDGVNSNRYMQLYYNYSGATGCGTIPSGLYAAPTNELCAAQTNDGRVTYFYYDQNGNMTVVLKPGSDVTEYEYQSVQNNGVTIGYQLAGVRDDLGNDVVNAGGRSDDQTTYTTFQYDAIGRITSVTAPASTSGGTQLTKSYNYGNISASWQPAADTNDTGASLASGASPVSVSWDQSDIYLFARGTANDLIYKSWNGSNWTNWASLGECIEGDPSSTSWGPERIDVVAEGCNTSGGNLDHIWFNGVWQAWEQIGGSQVITSAPTVTSWGNGRLDIFAQASGNTLYHEWDNNLGWGAGENLGGCIAGAPDATSWGNQRLDIFAQHCSGSGNNLDQETFNGVWQPWQTDSLHISNQPSVASITSGQIDVVSTNSSNQVEQATYTTGGGWTGWNILSLCSNVRPSFSYRQFGTGAYDLFAQSCTSGNSDIFWQTYGQPYGTTTKHISGATEPAGYSERVIYDNLDRTVADYDVEGQATTTQWNPTKDLAYSVTNPEGFMTSTIYNGSDRAVTSYGSAPASWFTTSTDPVTGYTDVTPLSSHTSQVARSDVSYDQGLTGLGVAYMIVPPEAGSNDAILSGAPLLHSTNIASDGTMTHSWGTANPIPGQSGNWGFSMTGTMTLPTTGAWNIQVGSDEGMRMWIDNQLVVDDWKDNPYWTGNSNYTSVVTNNYTYNNAVANSVHNVRIDYYHLTVSTNASFSVSMTPPGGSQTNQVATYFSPNYGLATSGTSYDSTIGNATATASYGNNPSLGLPTSATVNPGGLNLTASSTYETSSSGYNRQTSQTSAGGSTTTYGYYGANDTVANPCVSGSTAAYQAGLLKTTTNPGATSGSSGIVTTVVYDNAGNIVATETNSDGWECKTYDARGRLTQDVIPAFNGNASRTVTYNYDVSGNPLTTSVTDSSGTITTNLDFLDRTIGYTDAAGDYTQTVFDNLGRMQSQVGALGTETYTYDGYNRLTEEVLNGDDLANPTYDQYGRLSQVAYPTAGTMKANYTYSTVTGAETGLTYTLSSGTVVSDTATPTQSGKIQSDVIASGSSSLTSSYSYDLAGRLTSANIGSNTYGYAYGSESNTCASGTNQNSGMSGNRTSQTINGASTTYCYNYSDQLVSSSNSAASQDTYDSHGNLTLMGTASPLHTYYDSSDRAWGMVQYNGSGNGNAAYYDYDASGRLTYREHDTITSGAWNLDGQYWYGYTNSGGAAALLYNNSGHITQQYASLPGGVNVTIYVGQTNHASKYSYNLPNLLGSTLLTTDGNGNNTSTGTGPASSFAYDPFGNPLPSSADPNNLGFGSYGFEGAADKMTETTLTSAPILMGARVYIPSLGRFTSVDPVPGGNVNDYTYPLDPINGSDLSGEFCLQSCSVASSLQPAGNPQPAGSVAQAPATSTYALQPTAYASRGTIVAAAAPAARVSHATAPVPQNSYSASPSAATVYGTKLTNISATAPPQMHYMSTQGGNFDFWGGVSSAMSYAGVGGLADAAAGCVEGAVAGSLVPGFGTGAGCLWGMGESLGLGAAIGAAWGFIDGGAYNRDRFDNGQPDGPSLNDILVRP